MSAIITDQLRILNSENFVAGIASTTNSYYAWIGLPNPTDFQSDWSENPPSPEKIREIYNDERDLYNENAKCTLYGASDAITAITFDDSNGVLHAGTSAGRSEFQGLNRINNTTTAVTTKISASNGLVAEQ